MNSDKAQYFNLTMDQIRQLAETQQSSGKDVQEETSDQAVTQCCLHGNKEEVGRFNTLPRRRKNVLPSPDIVKEVEIKNQKKSMTPNT